MTNAALPQPAVRNWTRAALEFFVKFGHEHSFRITPRSKYRKLADELWWHYEALHRFGYVYSWTDKGGLRLEIFKSIGGYWYRWICRATGRVVLEAFGGGTKTECRAEALTHATEYFER